MNSSLYRYGEWAYLEVDPSDGCTVRALAPPDRLYIPGSSTKLFSVSATLDDLGFDHRFETPVYAQGEVEDNTLAGDLVLVASGDLTMGGRTTPDGNVAYTSVDHTYANDVPGATLTPEGPLAGLDEIAEQVRESGITRVEGDVIIDDRLFDPPPAGEPDLDPWPSPITINDNVIDVEITPGKVGEAPKSVTWRPQVAPYHLDVQAKTVSADKPTTVSVSTASGGRIVVSGNIAADAGKQLRVASIEDPAAFARTALIEALERADAFAEAEGTPLEVTPLDPVEVVTDAMPLDQTVVSRLIGMSSARTRVRNDNTPASPLRWVRSWRSMLRWASCHEVIRSTHYPG